MKKTGENSLNISIGDINLQIESDKEFITQIKKFYSNFIVEEKSPIISIKVEYITETEFGKKFDSDAERPNVKIDKLSGVCIVRWQNLDGEFNLLKKEGILKCTHPISLTNFLRIIYTFILLEDQGFLIHASSLIRDGNGYLFPGKSGAGKTTITRLSGDAILLTDEVSLVKMVNGKFNIFGTPFWGELAIGGENTSIPLKAVYFPVKDEKGYIKHLKPSQALHKLLPNVLFFVNDEKLNENLFNLCYEFILNIPTYKLHFLPDPTFWRLIDAG